MKGIAILWIVFFHYFEAYDNGRYPSPLSADYFRDFFALFAPSSTIAMAVRGVEGVFLWVLQQGYIGVGVFVILSGFGLSYSLAKTGGPTGNWWTWYWKRVLRIYPMYWLAHLVYLVSPFEARLEPVDYRFFLSFLGDRFYPIYSIFFYLNAAWWFFGLLLQLYLITPLLYRLLQKVGSGWFLFLCALATVGTRMSFLTIYPQGEQMMVGFCGCRLWEFACGIALGAYYRREPDRAAKLLFGLAPLLAGIALFACGIRCYSSLGKLGYAFVVPLLGTGMFLISAQAARQFNRIPVAGAALSLVGAYSYGLFLLHQPYVIYLADRVKGYSLPAALGFAALFTTGLALLTIPAEKFVNRLASRLLRG
jgi:peptidoglycan/LPS O-acetylase OafA/YrhL